MNGFPHSVSSHEEAHLRILKIVEAAPEFRRAEHKLQYLYLLTPKGIGEKLRMTRAYLARKEAEYEALQAEIQALKREMTSANEPH